MKPKLQSGYFMLAAVAIVVFVGFVGIAATYLFSQSARSSANNLMATQAFYLAESGLQDATHRLSLASGSTCFALATPITNTLGAGGYSVGGSSGTTATKTTTLNGALTAAATTIPVTSTTGFDSSGIVEVDGEFMSYTTISGNSFLAVNRGFGGTTAAAHLTGAVMLQTECTLTSIGGVPNTTAQTATTLGDPQGLRTLTEAQWLGMGWVGGNVSGGAYQLYQYTRQTTLATSWTNHALTATGASNILGLDLASATVGWAVGNANATFLYWNGITWATEAQAGLPNTTVNAVYCTSTTNCIAVGNSNGARTYIAHWTGGTLTSWARLAAGSITGGPNVNFFGVNCSVSTPNDCWAVGNSATFLFSTNGGTSWTSQATGLPAVQYQSVFCNSSTDCWAVGVNSGGNVMIAHGVGAPGSTVWTRVTPTGAVVAHTLRTVFCNSTTDCWAGGDSDGNVLLYHWNGTNWTRSSPSPAINQSAEGIACITTSYCWAVGTSSAFLRWNGSVWALGMTGNPLVTLTSISFAPTTTETLWQESFPASH